MNQGLILIRQQSLCPADAVRWACLLEATAPKAGNVSPGRSFSDLHYSDFVQAAECTAKVLVRTDHGYAEAIAETAKLIAQTLHTNVNLGILLLLGPLVKTDQATLPDRPDENWQCRVRALLEHSDAQDCRWIYQAINVAAPGGMGNVDEMDLNEQAPEDILTAMRSAATRDRIAQNYADGFTDLFENVVPTLEAGLAEQSDLLSGIALAHQRLLIAQPDTLIARKAGWKVAHEVQHRADFAFQDAPKRASFDAYLRENHLNPGTTADLIAAGLYVLLRRRCE